MAETYMVRDLIAELQRLDPSEFTDVEEIKVRISDSPRIHVVREMTDREMEKIDARLYRYIQTNKAVLADQLKTAEQLEKRIELLKQRLRSLARTVKARRLPLS